MDFHDRTFRLTVYRRAVEMMNAEGLDATVVEHHYRGFKGGLDDGYVGIMSCECGTLVGHYVTAAFCEEAPIVEAVLKDGMRNARRILPIRHDALTISTVYY